jgi:hypothetical protein
MILALLLLAGLPDWVPAHWRSTDPASLALLQGTGVNCVLAPAESVTERFVLSAHRRDIAAVGVIRPNAEAPRQAARALKMGVDALALEGDFDPTVDRAIRAAPDPLPVIELPSRRHIDLDTRDPIAGTIEGLWPGIIIENGGSKVMAGPSSAPWIDTNTGFLHFLRAAVTSVSSALWIGATPPEETVTPVERYGIVIADAYAAGARWIVTLDDDLNRRLLHGDPKARDDWQRIGAYIQYFERRREWRGYRPFSRMAVLQDDHSGGLLSAGLLDLMFAQHIAVRSLPARRLNDETLAGLRTVINVEPSTAFSASQQQALARFAASGGVLLNPPANWRFGEDTPGRTSPNRKQLERIQDIWEILYNATARKNFGARSFNTAGILFNVLAAPDGQSLLIHLVNYTGFPAESITVHALGPWRRARVFQPGAPEKELSVYPVKGGTGIDLEKLDVVASLMVE